MSGNKLQKGVIGVKRRIAVFANAWSGKNLSDALEGLKTCAQEQDYDLFVFVSHAAPGMPENEQREEKRIYKLPELDEFDGVVIFSYTMNFTELVTDICERAARVNVPVVSVGTKLPGLPYIGMSNMESMCELVEHLVTEHNVRDVEFIAGPKDNENSGLRVEAVRKVFSKHAIPYDETIFHYGDWGVRGAMDMVREILDKRKDHLPDAILCANDNLAMGVCTVLENVGLKVPEDIIVTGYDNIYDGQIFYPSLCTVGQNDYQVGRTAGETLFRYMREGAVEDIVIPNRFIRNQSCGCPNHEVDQLRLEECKKRFYENMRNLEFGWSNSWISQAVLSSSNPENIRKNLNFYFKNTTMFESGTVYVLEDEKAKQFLAQEENSVSADGYSEELEVMAAVERHEVVPIVKIQRRELLPGYQKKENDSRTFLFMPLRFKDWVFGYAVVEDWLVSIGNGKMKIFLDIFSQTIEKLKQNIALEYLNNKLRDLYTRDALTGMYNRFGFDSEGSRIFDDCLQNKKNMMLMFIDINRMKLINDYYGHLQGDVALKTVAEVIMQSIRKDWVAIRFGGDEFLVIGQCDCEDEITEVQSVISEEVKRRGKAGSLPYYLSVSCGYLYFCPEESRSLDSYVKQADSAMYEIKAYMHAYDEELKEFVEKCSSFSEP